MRLSILNGTGVYSRRDHVISQIITHRKRILLLSLIAVCINGLFLAPSFGQEEMFFKHRFKNKNINPEMTHKVSVAKQNHSEIEFTEPEYLERNELPEMPVPQDKVLKLVTWNSQKFNNVQSLIDFQSLAQKVDFFLVQESLYTNTVVHQFEMASAFEWVGVKAYKYFGNFTGVITGSRYGSTNYKGFRSIQTEPVFKTTKSALISYFKTGGSENMAIVNLHALNFVTHQKYEVHLLPLIKELENFNGPMIVAGDFNTHLPERNRILGRWMEKLELKHVPVFNDDRRLRLDHIYVRGVVAKPAIIRKDIISADHFPMEMNFIIPSPES